MNVLSFFLNKKQQEAISKMMAEPEEEQEEEITFPPEHIELAKTHPAYFYRILRIKFSKAQEKLFNYYYKYAPKRLILRWARRLGKTRGVAMLMIFICIQEPKTPCLIFANSEDQVKKYAFKEVQDLCSHHAISPKVKELAAKSVAFFNGSTIDILGFGGQVDNKRGGGYRVVWGDETGWTPSKLMDIISPFMLTYANSLHIQTSTPGPKSEDFMFYGFHVEAEKHERWCDETKSDYNPRRWIELYCTHGLEPGFVRYGEWADRWMYVDEYDKYVAPMESIEEEREACGGPESDRYKSEFLALFGYTDGQFFRSEVIESSASDSEEHLYYDSTFWFNKEIHSTYKFFAGIDVAKVNDDTVVKVGWLRPDGVLQLVYSDPFNIQDFKRSVTSNGDKTFIDGHWLDFWMSRVMTTLNKFGLREAIIDATGMGTGYVDALRMKHPEITWQDYSFSPATKPELMFNLRNAMEQGKIIFSNKDIPLLQQLQNIIAEQSTKRASNISIHGASGKDDHVMTLALLVKISGLTGKYQNSSAVYARTKTDEEQKESDLSFLINTTKNQYERIYGTSHNSGLSGIPFQKRDYGKMNQGFGGDPFNFR